jgi:hypothetical protein
MLQRTILRASRQASRTPAFAPLRQSLVSTRVATAPTIRWYSDAPAAPATKEGEAAEKKEDAPNDEAAKLKTDIEKKDKEIVELKVRFPASWTLHRSKLTQSPGQIPPLRRRLPQLARAHKTRNPSCKGLCHPALCP